MADIIGGVINGDDFSVPDLSKLTTIDKDALIILGLLDGCRIIGQKLSETENDISLNKPLRIIMRPAGDGRIALDLIDFVIGSREGASIAIKQSAVALRYLPDNAIIQGYADHIANNN